MRELKITRVYDASPQQVWDAWTQPQQLARWWGKRGWIARRETIVLDVRPGGTFRVTTVNEQDGSEMINEGIYSEVDAPHKLAFGVTEVRFKDLGDGRTEMTFHTTTEASDELFQRMRQGVESAFGRLEEVLR
jgi:uncharacterized protein YndB with AHSA1/START domain